jgi:hypothetical protein
VVLQVGAIDALVELIFNIAHPELLFNVKLQVGGFITQIFRTLVFTPQLL